MRKFFLIFLLLLSPVSLNAESVMYAHFINVGQADATLLEFPCGAVLIDAGSQDDEYTEALVNYLNEFFRARSDLNRTINTVLITHNHIDHTNALKAVVNNFTVLNYIENGQSGGSGARNPKWLKEQVENGSLNLNLSTIENSQITSLPDKEGLTNAQIDPVSCSDIDPLIRVLAGRRDENPGWPVEEFDNKNNQSIVVRVDFGESSFLFTGDLEDAAIESLVKYYDGTDILDVDVYQVGHHGSYNATTTELLEAMTPEIAVISMGHWTFGRNGTNRFTTWWYGHPRKQTVEKLTLSITRRRSYPVSVPVAESSRHFRPYSVSDAIYGTGWYKKTIKVRATQSGRFRVTQVQ